MTIHLKVKPNSKVNKISKDVSGLVVKIHAQPQDGKANKALIEYLSEVFDVPKSYMEIVSGLTSPQKQVAISDQYKDQVLRVIETLKD